MRVKELKSKSLIKKENHGVSLPGWIWEAMYAPCVASGYSHFCYYIQKAIVAQLKRDGHFKGWQERVNNALAEKGQG
jgi:hypothetical protein